MTQREGRAFWANGKDSKGSVCLAYSRIARFRVAGVDIGESGKTGF